MIVKYMKVWENKELIKKDLPLSSKKMKEKRKKEKSNF
jgi:hypothetical protein